MDPQAKDNLGVQLGAVGKNLRSYLWLRKRRQLITVMVLLTIWLAFVAWFTVYYFSHPKVDSGGGELFVFMVVIPFTLLSLWMGRAKVQFQTDFLREFAIANGFNFEKTGIVNEAYGTIFRIYGYSPTVSDVIEASYQDQNVRLFLYDLTESAGKSSVTYQSTVMEIALDGKLPPLLLISKQHAKQAFWARKLEEDFGTHNKISLEGDFDDHFTLYAPAGIEVEALEIFNPRTMELMMHASEGFSVEFAANYVYIYDGQPVASEVELTKLFGLANQLINQINPISSRLQNDTKLETAATDLTSSRQQPFGASKTATLVLILLAIVGAIGGGLVTVLASANLSSSGSNDGLGVETQAYVAAIDRMQQLSTESTETNNVGAQLVALSQTALVQAQTARQRSKAEFWGGVGDFMNTQLDAGIALERAAIRDNAYDASPYLLEAQMEINKGDFVVAVGLADHALQQDNAYAAAARAKAYALADLGRNSEAKTVAQLANAIDTRANNTNDAQYDGTLIDSLDPNSTTPAHITVNSWWY
jgi:hypothetical protein